MNRGYFRVLVCGCVLVMAGGCGSPPADGEVRVVTVELEVTAAATATIEPTLTETAAALPTATVGATVRPIRVATAVAATVAAAQPTAGLATDIPATAIPPTEILPTEAPSTEGPPAATATMAEAVGALVIIGVDKREEVVSIRNDGGAAVDLGGWVLRSEKGSQDCGLGGVIEPGQVLQIWALGEDAGQGGFNCGFGSTIWNNDDPDRALLIDPSGAVVSEW